MKRVLKNPIITFILGAVIFSSITGVFAYSLLANNTGFTPKDTSWNVENVENALNSLKDDLKIKFDNLEIMSYQGNRVRKKTLTYVGPDYPPYNNLPQNIGVFIFN